MGAVALYTLMHKSIPVVDLQISEYAGSIEKIDHIHNPEHLPVGTIGTAGGEKGRPSRRLLDEWWLGRSIPASREGIEQILLGLNLRTRAALALKCYGLSLSDHYWICPKNSGMKWEDINFFQNEFSKDMGEILFGREPEGEGNISLISPDNTCDGWLKKKWIISDGKRFLMKGGSGDYQQEPVNEVIACAVMKRLGIEHIPYHLTFENGKPYSLCETFVTPHTELVSAWYVISLMHRSNNDSALTHLLRCCDKLGIPNVQEAINKMLILDYIISNSDRHYNNFGFIRNPETLEWYGLAPIYDSGTSLWHNTRFVGKEQESKPFKKSHGDQIKLVDSFNWYDRDKLKGIGEECLDILSKSEFIEPERRAALAEAVERRVKNIDKTK